MKIAGFQKVTLLDYPGEVACIIFTAGCNFRCPYCQNSALISLSSAQTGLYDEIMGYLHKRQGLLDGVVITGGEPLLHDDIAYFIKDIKEIGYKVKLDTNGSFPDRMKELVENKLVDYIAMDIKAVPERYDAASGRTFTENLRESIDFLKKTSLECEFRTTIAGGIHELSDILDIARFLSTEKPYFIQSYKKSDGVLSPYGLYSFPEEEIKSIAEKAAVYCPNIMVR